MTIGLLREKLIGVPDDANIASSVFGFGGIVTARQALEAISGSPDNDHIQLRPTDGDPKIDICRANELAKLFAV